MKKTGTIAIAVLAVIAVVFAILFFTGNGDKSSLTKLKETLETEKNELAAKVETLTADASKAAEEAAASLKAVTDEKDALAAQVETLTADASKAAEEAAANLKAVTDEKDALAAQVETLTADAAKAAEEAAAGLKTVTDEKDLLLGAVSAAVNNAMEDYVVKFGPPIYVTDTCQNGRFARLSVGSKFGVLGGQRVEFYRNKVRAGLAGQEESSRQVVGTGVVGGSQAPVENDGAWVLVNDYDESRRTVFRWTSARILPSANK